MKKLTLITLIVSLILLFASLTSWILHSNNFSIVASNLAVIILLIKVLWDNRHGLDN
ncbi:hypothetical protein R53718_MFFEMHAI_01405 [Fructobacillus evanidus]|uniref:hypothetical protein n=1 Tax=Fructobacillus evanidus TaxID=3064281 RepID=UPI002DA105D4|nr:hypothetical protein R53718_MFFEMHAI_01405 [Fructobacillus sp. LMG 32999]